MSHNTRLLGVLLPESLMILMLLMLKMKIESMQWKLIEADQALASCFDDADAVAGIDNAPVWLLAVAAVDRS